MLRTSAFPLAPVALLAAALLSPLGAQATTRVVTFDVLNGSATLPLAFSAGDTLRLNTFVSDETGALNQQITFSVAAGVGSFLGRAAWEISTAAGPGPRLIGVNIDVFGAGNVLVGSDSGVAVNNGFATSSLGDAIGPGIYTLKATGTAVREASLDMTLSFIAAVPEPQTYALMLAGLTMIGLLSARRRS